MILLKGGYTVKQWTSLEKGEWGWGVVREITVFYPVYYYLYNNFINDFENFNEPRKFRYQ